jgi:hypothetical protein
MEGKEDAFLRDLETWIRTIPEEERDKPINFENRVYTPNQLLEECRKATSVGESFREKISREIKKQISGEDPGWASITESSNDLAAIMAKLGIPRYFSDGFNPMDFTGYLARNREAVIEVRNKKDTHGYAFVGELQLDRDIERRLSDVRTQYEKEGRTIERLFFDLRGKERTVGLEWRRYPKLQTP